MFNTVDAQKNADYYEEEKGIEQRRGNLSIFLSSIYEAVNNITVVILNNIPA
jgi:hypothetical protein